MLDGGFMDIRRLSLWEGRYATYMSNDVFSAVIEDQGDVTLEITSRTLSGARINALSLPYFRATGSGVMSDENGEWWQNRQSLYQGGGSYFTFPGKEGDHISSIDTYWTLRRYGTEEEHGGHGTPEREALHAYLVGLDIRQGLEIFRPCDEIPHRDLRKVLVYQVSTGASVMPRGPAVGCDLYDAVTGPPLVVFRRSRPAVAYHRRVRTAVYVHVDRIFP